MCRYPKTKLPERKMDTYGWVSIQPSQPKQAIPRTGFDLNVFFSGIFTVSACPVAYAPLDLIRLSTVIYMNCAIKSLHLLRQCDLPARARISFPFLFRSESNVFKLLRCAAVSYNNALLGVFLVLTWTTRGPY